MSGMMTEPSHFAERPDRRPSQTFADLSHFRRQSFTHSAYHADTFACPEAKLPHLARLMDLPKEDCLQRFGVPSNLARVCIYAQHAH